MTDYARRSPARCRRFELIGSGWLSLHHYCCLGPSSDRRYGHASCAWTWDTPVLRVLRPSGRCASLAVYRSLSYSAFPGQHGCLHFILFLQSHLVTTFLSYNNFTSYHSPTTAYSRWGSCGQYAAGRQTQSSTIVDQQRSLQLPHRNRPCLGIWRLHHLFDTKVFSDYLLNIISVYQT